MNITIKVEDERFRDVNPEEAREIILWMLENQVYWHETLKNVKIDID